MPRIARVQKEANTPIEVENDMIRYEGFIVIDKDKGFVKISKRHPTLNSNEVCFKLITEVPKEIWNARIQTVKATFSKSNLPKFPEIVSAIEQIEI